MLVNRSSISHPIVALPAAVFVGLLGLGVGCSSSSDDLPAGPTTTFYGVYTDPVIVAGTIELSGRPAPAMAAHTLGGVGPNAMTLAGTLTLAGHAPMTITGTYDPDSGQILLASDDQSYTFGGSVYSGRASGEVLGPNGRGLFTLIHGGTPATTATYCGTAICDTPKGCTATGSFNVVVSGTVALVAATYDGAVGVGAGTSTAYGVDLLIQNGNPDISIHGTISGSMISGTWRDNTTAYTGTWDGSTAQCTAAGFRR